MRPGSDLDDFEDYFDHRFRTLRRTAYALTGSWERAEELTQDTFARLYRHWPRGAGIDAYARRTLTNLFLDRRQYKAEIPTADVPERAAAFIPVADQPKACDHYR